MQIRNAQFAAGSPERSTYGTTVVRKNALRFRRNSSLLLQYSPCVDPSGIEQRYLLVIAIFFARIFTVPDNDNFFLRIDIRPANAANLVLAHRGRNCEA